MSAVRRIAQFIETGGPGGAERVVLDLARNYRDRGLWTCVITLRRGWLTAALEKEGITHLHLPSERTGDVLLPWRLGRLLRRDSVQVLHSHLLDSNVYGALAAKLAGIRHVATEHGDIHHPDPKSRLMLKLRLLSLLRTEVVAVSKFTADALVARGIGRERIRVLLNPIALDGAKGDGRALRQRLGLPPECWLWIHVANLRKVKDQRTLLAGYARARRMTAEPQFLCITGDGEERSDLESFAVELGIGDSVAFVGFQDQIGDWLRAADGFLLTSLSEAMPLSLLEAGAAGLYAIASDVGGVSQVLADGRGALVARGDPEALAAEMKFALEQRELVRQRADALKEWVRANCNLELVAGRYRELYDRV